MTSGDGDDQAWLIAALASELTHVRQRGLDDLDLDAPTHRQKPVTAPNLERLARRYAGNGHTARIPLIQNVLRDGLDAWQREGYEAEARFIRGLFFAADDSGSPRQRPRDLLAAVRGRTPEDDFRRRRQDLFRRFAAHLVTPVAARQPTQVRSRRTAALLAGTALLVNAGGALLLIERSDRPSGTAAGGPPGVSGSPAGPTVSDGGLPTFRFNDLSSGSPYIHVFSGGRPDDLLQNGTFRDGQSAPAVCKTAGRLVASDPSVGEHPRQSDIWVGIIETSCSVQYAGLPYGDMAPEGLEALPPCSGG